MLSYHDQMGREVVLRSHPKRVVSLVPSITEYLIDLGAEVVGRTRFCIHPKVQVSDIPIIGGTKNFHFERIRKLDPDLIIGSKEENYEVGVRQLEEVFPVWMSDVLTIKGARAMMGSLGEILQKPSESLIKSFDEKMASIRGIAEGSVLYLIWKKPWMAAGQGTFINAVLEHMGYKNVVRTERYPSFSLEELVALNPDHLLLSSEPYPFKGKDLTEIGTCFEKTKVKLVNGEAYSWYGSRMGKL